MSAPAMRRNFSLHFNGGSTHVEADCTASRTLAELLADSLFSAFPPFTALRAASAGSKARSKELEQEMERWYVCRAPASTLTSPLPFLSEEGSNGKGGGGSSSSSAPKGRLKKHGGADDMTDIPLSTATQIAPCELFIVALAGDGTASAATASATATGGGSGTTARPRRGGASAPAAKAAAPRGGRRKATPSSSTVTPPRQKRKYTRRATATTAAAATPVNVDESGNDDDSVKSAEDDAGSSASASASEERGSGSGDSGGDSSDADSTDESRGSRRGSADSQVDTDEEDDDESDGEGADSSGAEEERSSELDSSGSASSETDTSPSASTNGSDSGDDSSATSDAESGSEGEDTEGSGRRGRGRARRRPRRAKTEARPHGRRGGRRAASTNSPPATAGASTALGPDGTPRPKRKYTRRVKRESATGAEPEDSTGSGKAAPTRQRGRTRTKSAPRRGGRRATNADSTPPSSSASGAVSAHAAAATTASSRSAPGTSLLMTPDGQPLKRKRGRPPKNPPRYVEAASAAVTGAGSDRGSSQPPVGRGGEGGSTTTHTRGHSSVPSEPIPLPPRRKRNRTRSPGPNVVAAASAEGSSGLWLPTGGLGIGSLTEGGGGSAMGTPPLTSSSPSAFAGAARGDTVAGLPPAMTPLESSGEVQGLLAGRSATAHGTSPSTTTTTTGATLSGLREAQLKLLEQQRLRLAAVSTGAGPSSSTMDGGLGTSGVAKGVGMLGGGKSIVASDDELTEEAMRQAAWLQEQQARLQRRLLIHFCEYEATGDDDPSSREASERSHEGGGPLTSSTSKADGGKAVTSASDAPLTGCEDAVTLSRFFPALARSPTGACEGSDVAANLDSVTYSCRSLRSLFAADASQQRLRSLAHDEAAAMSDSLLLPRCFQLPRVLDDAARLASTGGNDSVTTAAAAAEGATTPAFLLSHPQMCHAVPELSLYAGLAVACETAMRPTANAPMSAALPISGKLVAGRAAAEPSVKKEETNEEDDGSTGVSESKAGTATSALAFSCPTLPPAALLEEEEVSAMASRRMFTCRLAVPTSAEATSPGAEATVTSGEEGTGEAEEEVVDGYCDPTQVSVSIPIVVGGCVRLVNPESREKSHQWTVYVRGLFNGYPPTTAAAAGATTTTASPGKGRLASAEVQEEETDYLSAFVDHVTFILDRSFTPCVRTVYKAPFEVTEEGWGEFVLSIHVHLRFPGFNPLTRTMKRVLKCYLSGSGGRAPLVASTGPGRGASGLDPVTSLTLSAPGSPRSAHVGLASNADTNMLVDSFLDVNFNSAARSLYYRGPFLPPHLSADANPYLRERRDRRGRCDGGDDDGSDELGRTSGHGDESFRADGHTEQEEEEDEDDEVDSQELHTLLRDYLRDRDDERVSTTSGDHGGMGDFGAAGDDWDDADAFIGGVKQEASGGAVGGGLAASEDGGGADSSRVSSSLQSPTLSMASAPDFGAVSSSPTPAAAAVAARAPSSPRRRGLRGWRGPPGRSASQTLPPGSPTGVSGTAGGPVPSPSSVLRAGHGGNVVVLSHLLRFSHRQKAPPLVPPRGDVRAPKKFEHLGYTLVPEPVVTEHYDELVIPLHSLTHSVKFARHYKGIRSMLRREEATHAALVAQFHHRRRADSFAKDSAGGDEGEFENQEEEEPRSQQAANHTTGTAFEHIKAIRQCEERIRVLQRVLVELTRVMRADRRVLRSAAILESRLRSALQVYFLSTRPPSAAPPAATPTAPGAEPMAALALPFSPYFAQLQPPPPPSSAGLSPSQGSGGGGGVSVWSHICAHGNAAEKDILLTLSYLASVAQSAWDEQWLGFALLQARQRVLPDPRLRAGAGSSDGSEDGVGAASKHGSARGSRSAPGPVLSPSKVAKPVSPSPTSSAPTDLRVKTEASDGDNAPDGAAEARAKGYFMRRKAAHLLQTSFYTRLASSAIPLTDVEFDLSAALLIASLSGGLPSLLPSSSLDEREDAFRAEGSDKSITTTTAELFAALVLPRAAEVGAAVLSTLLQERGSSAALDESKNEQGQEARDVKGSRVDGGLYTPPHIALTASSYRRRSFTSPAKTEEAEPTEEVMDNGSGDEDDAHERSRAALRPLALAGRLRFPLYTDAVPGSTDPRTATATTPSFTLDPFTATMIPAPPSHGHGQHVSGHHSSTAHGRAQAAAAAAALLRSRGLLPPPASSLPASTSMSSTASPSSLPSLAGTLNAASTFASGEPKLMFGEAADVAQLQAMRASLEEAIHAMRAEAARRQSALSVRQV